MCACGLGGNRETEQCRNDEGAELRGHRILLREAKIAPALGDGQEESASRAEEILPRCPVGEDDAPRRYGGNAWMEGETTARQLGWRDRYNTFIDRHEIVWELTFAVSAVVWVIVGFVGPGSGADPEAVFYTNAFLTVAFVDEFASRYLALTTGGCICAATGSI